MDAKKGLYSFVTGCLTLLLSACGGGGGSGSDPTYYGVVGVKNGSAFTACIIDMVFVDPNSTNGKAVTANIVAYYGITGAFNSYSGTGKTCSEQFPTVNSAITVDFYNSTVRFASTSGSGSGAGSGTGSGTGSGAGSGTGSGTGSGSVTYVTWTNNVNGEVIMDSGNERYVVGNSDRLVYHLGTGRALSGLTINSSAQIVNQGVVKGVVTLVSATGGGQLAVFQCADGSFMDIVVTTGWTMTCSSGSGGSSGGSTGGNTGGNTGGGSSSRSFITWSNSINGEIVKDANNENFSFYSDTRCIYSHNTQTETSNFCLTASYNANFAGQAVQVVKARAADNSGCIAVLADPSGYQIDIFTSSSGIQTVTRQSVQWDYTGCQ